MSSLNGPIESMSQLAWGSERVEFWPLASCTMPTYGRPGFIGESAAMFLANDYPAKELVILNDCPDQEFLSSHLQIRVTNCPTRFATLGEKRNHCIQAAAGTSIVVWDDDDLYFPWHITQAIQSMRCHATPFYRPAEFLAYWGETYLHDNQAVPGWVNHSATTYSRRIWEQVGGYPAMGVGEDGDFFRRIHERLVKDFIKYPLRKEERSFLLRGKSEYAHMSIGGGQNALDTRLGVHRIAPQPIRDEQLRQLQDRHLASFCALHQASTLTKPELSICVSVKNRSRIVDGGREFLIFPECVKSLAAACRHRNVELVITDFESTDWPLRDWIAGASGDLRVSVIECAGDFSRGRGLNIGAGAASSDRLLILDADVLVTQAMVDQAIKIVDDGNTWFPIFEDLNEHGEPAGWRDLTHGIAAISKELYHRVGGVPEFCSWGGDDDLFYEAVCKHVSPERGRFEGLRHQWHPEAARHVHHVRPRQTDYHAFVTRQANTQAPQAKTEKYPSVTIRLGDQRVIRWIFQYDHDFHFMTANLLPWALPDAERVDTRRADFTVAVFARDPADMLDGIDGGLKFMLAAEIETRHTALPDAVSIVCAQRPEDANRDCRYGPTLCCWAPPLSPARKTRVCSAVENGTYAWRSKLIQEAQQQIPRFDLFGRLGNRSLGGYHGRGNGRFGNDKYLALEDYAFSIGIERACETDYVTEKLTDPIMCEAVPIYRGAPNITDYCLPEAILNFDELSNVDWSNWEALYAAKRPYLLRQKELLRTRFNVFSYFEVLTRDLSLLDHQRPITIERPY